MGQRSAPAHLGAPESTAILETLVSSAPVGVAYVDLDLRIWHINGILASINGASVEEHLGRRVPEVLPGLWPQLEPLYRAVLQTGMPVLNRQVERFSPTAPDEHRVWLASYYPVRVDSDMIGVCAVVTDVTDREEAEEFRATVLENIAEGLCVLDRENRLVMMNSAAATMLGYQKHELVGKSMHAAIHFQHADGSPHPEEECQLMQAPRQGRTVRDDDDVFTRKDGAIFPVAYSAAPLRRGGKVSGSVVVFRDIPGRRRSRRSSRPSWIG